VPVGASEEAIFATAEAEENVQHAVGGKPIKKRIYVITFAFIHVLLKR
jgi:leucyl-tRNA synthetase